MPKKKITTSPQSYTRTRKLTRATSQTLQEMANQLGWVLAFRPIGMGYAEYENKKARQRAYEEREYLRLLARRKFIQTKRTGQRLMCRLTAKGWQQALREKIRTTTQQHPDKICLVIFDVPESERRVRDTLRNILADLEFKMIQKSVWFTNKDVIPELCALLQGANLQQWVRIIAGQEVHQILVRRMATRLSATKEIKNKNLVNINFMRP